jgi:hypothetical protein
MMIGSLCTEGNNGLAQPISDRLRLGGLEGFALARDIAWGQFSSLRVDERNLIDILTLEELLRDLIEMLGPVRTLRFSGMGCRGDRDPVELLRRRSERLPKRFEIIEEIRIGYVPANLNLVCSRLMDAGKLFFARVVSCKPDGDWTQITANVYMVE